MTELDYKRKASELLAKGRYDDAVAQYRELIASSKKKNPAILNLIGDIYVKQGAFENAFESYVEASRLYAEEGLFHNGIAVGKKILRLDREQTEVYGILGNLYARQGLGMDSIKFLDEYGRRKEALDEFPAALAAFAEACEVLADCAEAHIAYGGMLERVGRREDAAVNYRTAADVYRKKGQTEAASHWARRASSEEAADGDEVQDVSELMNLKTLNDDEPAKRPAPKPPAPPPPAPMPVSDPDVPWAAFDQDANPGLPAPPPLPARDTTPPLPTGSSSPVAEPTGASFGLDDSGQAEDGLELEIRSSPFPSSTPAEPDEPLETVTPGPPEATAASVPELASSEDGDADSTAAFALRDLPGIILPDKALEDELAPEPPLATSSPTASPEEPPLAEEPSAASRAPAESPEESLFAAPPPVAPGSPAPAEPPSFAESGVPTGPDPAEADLASFFETSARTESNEQAIVIGDDFELLREGGDVSEVIADFRAATDEILDLDDHQAHYDLGTTYMEMELFDESAAEFEIAAQGEQWALASREMLGYCFLRKGQIELAIRELRKGLEIPGHDERDKLGLLYNLGIACGVLDSEQEAIESFQRILEVDPNFRDTRLRLERLVQASG